MFGKLLIYSVRIDSTHDSDVIVECELDGEKACFHGFYYLWPGDHYYLVIHRSDNPLNEYHLMVTYNEASISGPAYLTIDMTGSIRYYR